MSQSFGAKLAVTQKLSINLGYDPAILFLHMHLRELKTYVHRKVGISAYQHYCNNPKLETIQVSINCRMDRSKRV